MVHALKGKEHVEWDNPYDVGMTGLIGFASGYYAMMDCDILLMLGTDFPYRQFYPKGKAVRIAQVDLRPGQIGRRTAVDLGLVGDVRATINALLPLLKTKNDRAHRKLSAQFADHGRTGPLERAYLAFVWGAPDRPKGTIDAPIDRHPKARDKMAVRANRACNPPCRCR